MAFYLQLLNRAFNQAHVDGKFSATELQSILQQLGFDAAVGADIKDKVCELFFFFSLVCAAISDL